MRGINIPPFPRKFENPNLENLFRVRLSTTVVMWPDQALPLLCYMCFPNDEAARDDLLSTLWSWEDASEPPATLDKLRRIQADWLRVADVFHLYCDLIEASTSSDVADQVLAKPSHSSQRRQKTGERGNPNSGSFGRPTSVAHLVTAASLVRQEVRNRYSAGPPGSLGLSPTQFVPFQMAMLMPDLVLAVAMEFERYGLGSDACPEPAFDPDMLWRIPAGINIVPVPLPIRKLSPQDIIVLKNRRAGNRGRARAKTQ